MWKVLERDRNGNLVSPGVGGILELTYRPGETTIAIPELWALGFGLFVFRNLDAARKYKAYGQEIWKVKVRSIKPAPKMVYWGDYDQKLDEIASDIENDRDMDCLIGLCGANLEDMAIVKSVTLVERVD